MSLCILFIFKNVTEAQITKNISLQEAIQLALETNPDILQAKQEINVARGRILQSGRIPNPEVGFTFNEILPNNKIGSANEKDISISQSFEYPTKRSSRVSVASFDEQLAIITVEQMKVRVSVNVKKSYINTQYLHAIVRSTQMQIELFQDFQKIVSNKYKTGESKYLDVLRIEVEIAHLQNELVEAENNYFVSQTELKNIIGDSRGTLYAPEDSLTYTSTNYNKDSLFAVLIQQSNTLQLAGMRIDKQKINLSLAQTSYYPDFGVGLAYQQRTPSNSFLGVEFKIAVPLWFWQEPRGQTEEATAQLTIAELQRLTIERKIRNNLSAAFINVEATEKQIWNYNQILRKGLSDILNVALTQYRNNQLDILNFFDIYRTYRTTQTDYVRAVANYRRALAELEVAAEIQLN